MRYGNMPSSVLIDIRKGPTIHFDCGDLPEVPEWLMKELDVIKERLDREIAEHAARLQSEST